MRGDGGIYSREVRVCYMAQRVGANLGRVLNRAKPLFEEKWDMTLVIKQMKHVTVDLHHNNNDPAHH